MHEEGSAPGLLILFLPVYKRIETEVVDLANHIFFNNKQLNVYSLSIADLIIRCSVEIESISKDLYKQLGGNMKPVDSVTGKNRDLYFDTDCIAKLVNEWDIDKKQLQISNPNMFFEGKKAILTPLHKSHKRGTSGSKWKRAYQSLKHNRSEFIKCASIENLLNALGALYILNVYYSNESFWMETPVEGRREYTVDSEVFTPFVCDASHILIDIDMTEDMMSPIENPSLPQSIYVLKYRDGVFEALHKDMCKDNIRALIRIRFSDVYIDYIKNHPEDGKHAPVDVAKKIGVDIYQLLKIDSTFGSTLKRLKEKEIVLNKKQQLYPSLHYQQFIESEEGQKFVEEFTNRFKNENIRLPMLNR